jgi:hypothetical protein
VLRDGGVGDEAVLDLAHEDADGIGLDELGRDGLDLLFVCVVEVWEEGERERERETEGNE